MKDFSIHTLGGCGTQTKERNYSDSMFGACVVAETSEALYVLDAGDPAAFVLKDQELNKPVRGVFISHMDGDHVNGLISILMECPCKGATVALPMPQKELDKWPGFIESMSLFTPNSKNFKFEQLAKGYRFEEDGFSLESRPVMHNRSMTTVNHLPHKPFVDYHPSFSFRIKYDGFTIIYSADYELPTELDDWLSEGADLAILEHAHTPQMDIYSKMLAKYTGLKRIAFTHYYPARGNPDEIVSSARKNISKDTELMWAIPGMEFKFGDSEEDEPSEIIPFTERIKNKKPFTWATEDEVRSMCETRGIPMEWHLLGPFENPVENGVYIGLDTDYGVEKTAPDLEREFKGKGGVSIKWSKAPLKSIAATPSHEGRLDLCDLIGVMNDSLAYAYAKFAVPEDGLYDILFGSDDGVCMWIDGEKVFYLNQTRGGFPDQDSIQMELKKGEHEVVLAIDQRFGGWNFYWRVVKGT